MVKYFLKNKSIHSKKSLYGFGQRLLTNPTTTVLLSFCAAIAIGTFLLSLPQATHGEARVSFIDAFFTATSATCVTGLIVKNTPLYFTRFGHIVILVLIQIGGLGVMTLSAFFAIALRRRMSLTSQVAVGEVLDVGSLQEVKRIVLYIVLFTLLVELMGAGAIYFLFSAHTADTAHCMFSSFFHSISAFCNAGFSLFPDSLEQFRSMFAVNAVFIVLIIIGGIGFPVLMDIQGVFVRNKRIPRRLTFHTKLVLIMTAVLLIIGSFGIFLLEQDQSLRGMYVHEKIGASIFQSVTARTAGFNTVPIADLSLPTRLLLMVLMFCGAAPGSTAGGIKVTTMAIIIMMLVTRLRKQEVVLLNRRLPAIAIDRAFVVLIGSFMIVSLATFFLLMCEQAPFDEVLFEVFSAFGTVGLSCGLTPHLSSCGRVIIAVTMLCGRIGPLILALSVKEVVSSSRIQYPEERVMVG